MEKILHTQHMFKDPVIHVRVQWVMETPNNPECTKSVRIFLMLTVDKKNNTLIVIH